VQNPAQQTYFGQDHRSTADQESWGQSPWEATAGTTPIANWAGGGSSWAEPTGPSFDQDHDGVYAAEYEEEESLGSTNTDTSSDSGEEDIQAPDVSHLSDADAAEQIYLRYRRAKRTWRRFTGRPVRKFRRHIKRHAYFRKGKGRGRKGKGKGSKSSTGGFMWTRDDTLAYLKGKGKSNRAHTSGKGFGRRRNPKDKHGNVMKCRICNSEEHFAAKCPNKGGGKGAGPSGFFQHASAPSGGGSHCAAPARASTD